MASDSKTLSIPFRRTHAVTLSTALKQYISTKYDQHPDMFASDLAAIDQMRAEAANVQEPHQSGLARLVAYAAQVMWIGGKFPVDVGVEFCWYTALGLSRSTSQNNIRFEHANILFNLVALYSQLAVTLNQTSSDGLKTAANYLCQAAGVISYLRTDIIPDMRTTVIPEDMDDMTLQCLEQLMLAQAQECFWQKAIKDKLKDASIARLAARVSDYYSYAGDHGIKSNAISSEWLHHMNAKHHHFAAAAQLRQSRDCLEKRKYGEEIARLRDSLACVNEGLKESRYINRHVKGDLNELKTRVSEDLKRAEKDNDVIYLQEVPPKSALKTLDRANMVVAKTPKEVAEPLPMLGPKGSLGPALFSELVPYAVHIAASIYADRRDRLVNQQIIGDLELMTSKLHDLLQSLNLPGSLQALEKPLGLPPNLISHAEELRQQDAINRLRRAMEDTAKVKNNDQDIFTEAITLLNTEKAEDDRARARYGTERWTRPRSEVAGERLHKLVKEYQGYMSSAEASDNLVRTKLKDSERVIGILAGTNRDLERFVPNSREAALSPQVSRETSRLRSCLNEESRLRARRIRKIEALKEKAKADDIHSALRSETSRLEREFPMQKIEPGQFENLFEERLQLYDEDREALAQENSEQEQLVARIREANDAFLAVRRGDSSTKEREKALQDLENGYFKYKEILSNIDVGRKFYNDLAKIVGRFREDCKVFVQQRRAESSHMEQEIANNAAMASLTIGQTSLQRERDENHNQAALDARAPAHEPLTAPMPTRVVAPSVSSPGTMWNPAMGIKFADQNAANNPHNAAYPETRRAGPWDASQGLRFS